jgi:hypothetical protein
MLKRFDAQVQSYNDKIERQKRIIDRLLAANVAYADGLYEVLNDVKNVKDARTVARSATEKAQAILAVESDAGPTEMKEN